MRNKYEILDNNIIIEVKFNGEKAYTIASIEHLDKLLGFNTTWHGQRTAENSVYIYTNGNDNKKISMHRFLMDNPENKVVHHINGLTFDNRMKNLLVCTQETNMHHRKVNKNSSTGVNGVTKTKSGKWRSRISTNGKQLTLGVFELFHEAVAVRKFSEEMLWK